MNMGLLVNGINYCCPRSFLLVSILFLLFSKTEFYLTCQRKISWYIQSFAAGLKDWNATAVDWKPFVRLKYNRPIEGCNTWAQILEMKPCQGWSLICFKWIKKPTPPILMLEKKKRGYSCKLHTNPAITHFFLIKSLRRNIISKRNNPSSEKRNSVNVRTRPACP